MSRIQTEVKKKRVQHHQRCEPDTSNTTHSHKSHKSRRPELLNHSSLKNIQQHREQGGSKEYPVSKSTSKWRFPDSDHHHHSHSDRFRWCPDQRSNHKLKKQEKPHYSIETPTSREHSDFSIEQSLSFDDSPGPSMLSRDRSRSRSIDKSRLLFSPSSPTKERIDSISRKGKEEEETRRFPGPSDSTPVQKYVSIDNKKQDYGNIEDVFEDTAFWNRPAGFCLFILGQPGTGKSSLISALIQPEMPKSGSSPRLKGSLFQHFDWVFFFTPDGIPHIPMKKGENWFENISIVIIKQILAWINDDIGGEEDGEVKGKDGISIYDPKSESSKVKVLFIIDDKAWQLKGIGPELSDLLFRRRHLCGDRVSLSVIISTQKYTGVIPTSLREAATDIIIFKITKESFEQTIGNQILGVSETRRAWNFMCGFWNGGNHNFFYYPLCGDHFWIDGTTKISINVFR